MNFDTNTLTVRNIGTTLAIFTIKGLPYVISTGEHITVQAQLGDLHVIDRSLGKLEVTLNSPGYYYCEWR